MELICRSKNAIFISKSFFICQILTFEISRQYFFIPEFCLCSKNHVSYQFHSILDQKKTNLPWILIWKIYIPIKQFTDFDLFLKLKFPPFWPFQGVCGSVIDPIGKQRALYYFNFLRSLTFASMTFSIYLQKNRFSDNFLLSDIDHPQILKLLGFNFFTNKSKNAINISVLS